MKYIFSLFFLAFFCLSASPVDAQSVEKRGYSLQEIVRKTMRHINIDQSLYPKNKLDPGLDGLKLVQHRPDGNVRLEYDLLLPPRFDQEIETVYDQGRVGGLIVTDSLFSRIARYIGPAVIDHSPVIEIQVRKLKFEVSAKDYIENYLERVALTTLKVEGGQDGKDVRTIHIGLNDGRPEVIFSRGLIHGDLIFYITFSIPVDGVEKYAITAPKVLESFSPAAKATGQIEPRKSQKLLNVLAFEYPSSWKLKNRRIGSSFEVGADLFNYDVTGRTDGFIKIESHRKTFGKKPSTELKNLINDFEETGLVVKKKIRNFDLPDYDQSIGFSTGEVYLLSYNEPNIEEELITLRELRGMGNKFINHELWLMVADSGKFIHYVVLLTPSEEEFPDIWSRNRLAYKIVINSLDFNP